MHYVVCDEVTANDQFRNTVLIIFFYFEILFCDLFLLDSVALQHDRVRR